MILRPILQPILRPILRSPTAAGAGPRPSLFLDFLTGYNDPRITYSGGANGTRVNSAGLIVAATTPRFDYNPVTLAPLGLLVEEIRTNVALYSQEFDNAAFNKSGVTVTANASTGPDGVATADKLITNAVAGFHNINQTIGSRTASVAYTYSFYAKAAEIGFCLPNINSGLTGSQIQALVDLTTGAVSSVSAGLTATTQDAGNGWWRVILTATGDGNTSGFLATINTTDATGNPDFTGNGVDGIYVCGFQVEQGAFATSYIPTTSASVTKTLDSGILPSPAFAAIWSALANSGVVQFRTGPVTGIRPIVSFDDGTANQQIRLYTSGTSLKFTVTDGGVTQCDLTLGTVAAYTAYKAAFAVAANDFAAVMTGGTVQTDASGTVPVVDRQRFGSDFAGNAMNGHVARDQNFQSRLPNATLQALTA